MNSIPSPIIIRKIQYMIPAIPMQTEIPGFMLPYTITDQKRKAFWNFAEVSGSYENYPADKGNRTRVIATYVGEPQPGIDPGTRRASAQVTLNASSCIPTPVMTKSCRRSSTGNFSGWGEVILNYAEAAAEADKLSRSNNCSKRDQKPGRHATGTRWFNQETS